MPRLNLHALPAFRAVAERENLRAAAEVLHLTHSAISQQVQALEESLGFALFERRGRRVVLNPAGHALLASVQRALDELDQGVNTARAASSGPGDRLRITVLPSFAQRWLMPRIGQWRERHPSIPLEIEASIATVDLTREGYHAAVRQGRGPWAGLESERLFAQPPIVLVASPAMARRLAGAPAQAFTTEPLLGDADLWRAWFAANGLNVRPRPVAVFNDAGLMLQAAEQDLGLALSREVLAADALCDGRLVQLSPVAITHEDAQPYHFVYPPALRDWPPLRALREWLSDELKRSDGALRALRRAGAQRGANPRAERKRAPGRTRK